jgi:hypothetical protein
MLPGIELALAIGLVAGVTRCEGLPIRKRFLRLEAVRGEAAVFNGAPSQPAAADKLGLDADRSWSRRRR